MLPLMVAPKWLPPMVAPNVHFEKGVMVVEVCDD